MCHSQYSETSKAQKLFATAIWGVSLKAWFGTHPSRIADGSRLTTIALLYTKEPRVSTATSFDTGVIESLAATKAKVPVDEASA